MKQLARILTKETDSELIENLLLELFTRDEHEMIRQRLKIVALLRKKIPQYEIAKKLNASLCSITRGSRELRKDNSALAKIADEHLIPEMDFVSEVEMLKK